MTPVYLNPGPSSGSFPKEDHHLQLFLSPPNHHLSSSRTGSTSSVTTARDPRASVLLLGEPKQHHDRPPKGLQFYERSSGDDQHPISSSPVQPAVNGANNVGHKFELSEIRSEDWEESCGGKWMPSKIRLMQKMTRSTGLSTQAKADDDDDDDNKPMKFTLKLQDQRNHVNEISTSSSSSNQTHNTAAVIRVCSDCNTTTTPLWRSGPGGPKSLCNACGIRQRKARRAAAAASGDGTVEASPSSKTNQKLQAHKEKKPRSSHNIGQSKKSCNKPPPQNTKFCFKKIALSLSSNSAFQGAFSRDVEEAAILLMELSCGFIQS